MSKQKVKKQKNKKKNKKIVSTNEYVNLADVRGPFLYTKDNYIWQFIKVLPISTALMTQEEKKQLTMKMTRELSPIKMPFKILFLSRPTDVRRIVDFYEGIKQTTVNQRRRENITKTINYFDSLATSGGVLERQTYIAIWHKGIDEELIMTKTTEFKNALSTTGVTCNICDETDIKNMLGLFYNPSFDIKSKIDATPKYTFMEGYYNG